MNCDSGEVSLECEHTIPSVPSERRPLETACPHAHSPVRVFPPQFTELGMFETVWQVKFYNYNKRDHCQWGNSFNSIEYECKPNDTRTLMWVNKEMFV